MINSPTPVLRRQTKNIDDLVAVLRLLFGLGFEKIIQQSFAFPTLCENLNRLLIATFIDHWVPRILFVYLNI